MRAYDRNNVFARILRGEEPCIRVYEDEFALAFENNRPAAPVHVLVIPKGEYGGGDVNVWDWGTWHAEPETPDGRKAVDDGEVKRYREFDSFPGFEIDELAGRDFAKTVLELNLPPLRFEEVGSPGFYLGSARPAVFVGALAAKPADGSGRRTVYDAGAQVDLTFTVLSRLSMTLSFGYAAGFEDGRKLDDEWMLSLKVL